MDRKIATKDDWEIEEMPSQNEKFILNRTFTVEEMDVLHHGNIPQEMEDKWFWYMEDDTLHAHRSWTGICIYSIEFRNDNNHEVTVNRDPNQYSCTSIEEDTEQLNRLLDWWTQPSYDYYGEWLDETISAIKKPR